MKIKKIPRLPTLAEEIVNAMTHSAGVGFGATALVILLCFSIAQHDIWKIVSSILFGSTLVILYLCSSLYHSFTQPKLKKIFQKLDHIAIYFLIAGTYTPITLVSLRGGWGWTLFGIVWGLAIIGMFFKLFFINRFEKISTAFYLLMGWLAVVAIVPIYHHIPFTGLILLAAGGLSYTIGTIFYAWERAKYAHGIWHLFVMGGSVTHFLCVLFYIIAPA